MEPKRDVSLKMDAALVLAIDGLAAEQGGSRSQVVEVLLGLAIQERERQRTAEKKVSLTVRVSPRVVERVKGVAKASGVSTNQAAADLLESGLLATFQESQLVALDVLKENLLDAAEGRLEVIKQQSNRQAHLLSRAVLENLHNRQLIAALLVQQGLSPDQVKTLSESAFSRAVDQLKNPTPTLKLALADLLKSYL